MCRLRRHDRHAVLQLVAESVGAACLIESRARPDAAHQRLIQHPAIEHDVHRAIWRLHLNRTECFIPEGTHTAQHLIQIRCPVTSIAIPVHPSPTLPRQEDTTTSLLWPGSRTMEVCNAPAWIESGAGDARRAQYRRSSPAGSSSRPCRPMNSRRSPVHCVCWPARSAKATRELNPVFQGLRANMAPRLRVDLRHDEGRGRTA